MPTLLRVLSDAEVAAIHEQSAGRPREDRHADRLRARPADPGGCGRPGGRGRAPGPLPAGARGGGRSRPRRSSSRSAAAAPASRLPMNAGECTLMPDGESTMVYDPVTGVRRAPDLGRLGRRHEARRHDGRGRRLLADDQLRHRERRRARTARSRHWAKTFELFSKHVQDEIATRGRRRLAPGAPRRSSSAAARPSVATTRSRVLFCPVSPLAMEAEHTDAYLATAGWDIPIAIMPMPMMGTSAPTGLRSTVVSGNAEVLGAICLVQAAQPGHAGHLRPGARGDGAADRALGRRQPGALAAGRRDHRDGRASTGCPVTSSNGGTDHFVTGVQAAYERTHQLGPAGALVAGHPDRARVAGRRVHALPGADGHRRGDLPHVAPHPGRDRHRGGGGGRGRGARRGGPGRRLPQPDRDAGRRPRRRVLHAAARLPRHLRPLGGDGPAGRPRARPARSPGRPSTATRRSRSRTAWPRSWRGSSSGPGDEPG